MIRFVVAAALGLALSGCSARLGEQREAHWDREAVDAKKATPEASVSLPAYPQDADLVEFAVGPTGSHRYFIDAKTLEVGADGVVRYALVVKTTGGASNASYEGIRCSTREKRIYALGHPQRKWIPARRSVWEPIELGRRNEHQATLYKEFFCPDRSVPVSREAALEALRSDFYGTRGLKD